MVTLNLLHSTTYCKDDSVIMGQSKTFSLTADLPESVNRLTQTNQRHYIWRCKTLKPLILNNIKAEHGSPRVDFVS